MLYGFLGIVLAAATALSGFGYLRYHEKEDWRGATSSLLRIPERNRLIVFIWRMEEHLFDYYAQRSPAMGPAVAKIDLSLSFVERPKGREIYPVDINRLKLAVKSRKYSEVDLVISHGRHDDPNDPNELVLDYLSQALTRQEEQRFTGIRIVRFMAPPH